METYGGVYENKKHMQTHITYGAGNSITHAKKDAWEPQVCTHMNRRNTIGPIYVRVHK